MAFSGLVTPFFASFFGWYFLDETITWHYFASIAVFSVGLSIFYQEELKREKLFASPQTA
jgi:drug/metabolite transporter (DMT)-like permease